MASSVARMPREEWRDPGRLSSAVFGAHTHHHHHHHRRQSFSRQQKSALVRDRQHVAIAPATTDSNDPAVAAAAIREDKEEVDSPSFASAAAAEQQRQSQILDRWAARQARGMVTTIERQACEAELSALSTSSQPVAARAASLLLHRRRRDPSPAASDSSAASATTNNNSSIGFAAPLDTACNVRASSLIQMWRELEAEAGLAPTPRAAAAAGGTSAVSSGHSAAADEPSLNSDACDGSEASSGDWEPAAVHCSSAEADRSSGSCSGSCSGGGRVGCIVKMLTEGKKGQSPVARSEEGEGSTRRNSASADAGESVRSTASSGTALRPVRGRRDLEELVARMERERRRELAELAERQAVSRFAFRGRLQSMLRLRFLRRDVAARNEIWTPIPSTTQKPERKQGGAILSIRQRFDLRVQHQETSEAPIEQSSSSSALVEFPTDSEGSDSSPSSVQRTADNNQYQEDSSSSSQDERESTSPGLHSASSASDDLREECHSPDGSWDERSLWVNSLDWQQSMDSITPHSWQGEAVTEALESSQHSGHNDRPWLCDSPNSWRALEVSRQQMFHNLFENLSDNIEIRELLERRRVSTSLASDFCGKMNQLILSFLHRQGQQQYHDSNNFTDYYEEQPFWRSNDELQNNDLVASASSSLVPLSYQTFSNPNSQRHASLTPHVPQNLLETEAMQDMRSDMAQIHQEIGELRKLVENCLEWQASLQQSIKQEVSDAVRQAVAAVSFPSSSNPTNGRKGSCCICCEMQVDSLLYRCGHMCTCFKCAHELQWSSGKCPICRSPIIDVVRAYPNS
ncbi:uncharacterized protein LOC109715454 [Ananas comosus]|uniref:Uncharacterized protein LOC109715454 n=1 Tax=Ananas comosus TaxID=4615 RepID=A0A6P5FRC1_ANACO|nr:uncharacterized protein LOC109715454 [Ananas comosus]